MESAPPDTAHSTAPPRGSMSYSAVRARIRSSTALTSLQKWRMDN